MRIFVCVRVRDIKIRWRTKDNIIDYELCDCSIFTSSMLHIVHEFFDICSSVLVLFFQSIEKHRIKTNED